MNKLQALLGGACMVVLALGPGIAHAQAYPENSPEACTDRGDNDGDGYVDCYDPDCRGFAFCQQASQPPPPPQQYPQQYQQPPPQQYQQPPPVYYAPRPTYSYTQPPPGKGIAEVIVGFSLLIIGIGCAGGSYPMWVIGLGSNTPGSIFSSGERIGYLAGAITLDILATAMVIVGVILVPTGFGKMGKYSRWKKQQAGQAAMFEYKGMGFTPMLSLAPAHGSASGADASLGLKITF